MRTTTTIALALAASLVAAPLLAQERSEQDEKEGMSRMHRMMEHHPGMTGPMPMMGGMMGGEGMHRPRMMSMMIAGPGPAPRMLLHMKDALRLSDDQVSRLEEIRTNLQEERTTHMEAARTARKAAHEAMTREGSPDVDAHEEHLREAADHHVQAHMTMVRAHQQARDVLTDDQRSNVEFFGQMMEMMGRMMDRGGHGMEMEGRRMPGHPMKGHRMGEPERK